MKTYGLGMFGAGAIAQCIAEVTLDNQRIKMIGVASRNAENSKKFAAKYDILSYESYKKMLMDKDIDIAYISTPTKYHYEHIKMCLLAGKNVICEKPFVENENQAVEIFGIARQNGILLFDGLWNMYMPITNSLIDCTKMIGKIKYATASLGYPSVKKESNGSIQARYDLWDFEIYPLSIMLLLLGEPDSAKGKSKFQNNIKITNNTVLTYKNKTRARIYSSLIRRTLYTLGIFGSKGVIIAFKWWFGRYPIVVWKFPFKLSIKHFSHKKNGYEYEIDDAILSLDKHLNYSETYDESKTTTVLKWIEKIDESENR